MSNKDNWRDHRLSERPNEGRHTIQNRERLVIINSTQEKEQNKDTNFLYEYDKFKIIETDIKHLVFCCSLQLQHFFQSGANLVRKFLSVARPSD